MPQPPPFALLPDGLGSRVRALLAGAGRQRVAIGLLALAALAGGGFVWARAHPTPGRGDDRPGNGRPLGPDPAQSRAGHIRRGRTLRQAAVRLAARFAAPARLASPPKAAKRTTS